MKSLYQCDRCGKQFNYGYNWEIPDEERGNDSVDSPICAMTCEESHCIPADTGTLYWLAKGPTKKAIDSDNCAENALVTNLVYQSGDPYPSSAWIYMLQAVPNREYKRVIRIKFRATNTMDVLTDGEQPE